MFNQVKKIKERKDKLLAQKAEIRQKRKLLSEQEKIKKVLN